MRWAQGCQGVGGWKKARCNSGGGWELWVEGGVRGGLEGPGVTGPCGPFRRPTRIVGLLRAMGRPHVVLKRGVGHLLIVGRMNESMNPLTSLSLIRLSCLPFSRCLNT